MLHRCSSQTPIIAVITEILKYSSPINEILSNYGTHSDILNYLPNIFLATYPVWLLSPDCFPQPIIFHSTAIGFCTNCPLVVNYGIWRNRPILELSFLYWVLHTGPTRAYPTPNPPAVSLVRSGKFPLHYLLIYAQVHQTYSISILYSQVWYIPRSV